jgi:hypothetical protein
MLQFFHNHIPPRATQNVQIDHPNDIPLVAVAIQMIKRGQFGVREEPKSILKYQFWARTSFWKCLTRFVTTFITKDNFFNGKSGTPEQ